LPKNYNVVGNVFNAKILPFFEMPTVSIDKTIQFWIMHQMNAQALERKYS